MEGPVAECVGGQAVACLCICPKGPRRLAGHGCRAAASRSDAEGALELGGADPQDRSVAGPGPAGGGVVAQTRREFDAEFRAGAVRIVTRFFRKLLRGSRSVPRVLITDELASYGVAHRRLIPSVEHRRSKYLNNRVENSHQSTRQRERAMKGRPIRECSRNSYPPRAMSPSSTETIPSSPIMDV
jgi:hypothetical protein